MSLYAIGDIHGHSKAITALIDYVKPTAEDTVVFLGDYVDKGPDVCGVLEYLIKCSINDSWVFLRGNHDQMFLNARRDKSDFPMWECLSGESPLQSYSNGPLNDVINSIPEEHFDFLENRCVNFYETKDYIFVHAGISPHNDPIEEDVDRLQWSSLGIAAPHLSGKTVVCGHSSQPGGVIADLGHTICIDTGITKGDFISCLDLDTFNYTQVDAAGGILTGKLTGRDSS